MGRIAEGRPASGRRAHCLGASGFTLVEVLVALALFAIVSVGALGVLGATSAGGFQDTSPTALAAGRRAKDLTAAGVFLQAFQEYLAGRDDAVWSAVLATWPPDAAESTYCVRPGGMSCGGPYPMLPPAFGGYPVPGPGPSQVDWTTLEVVIQQWSWDCTRRRYAPDVTPPRGDRLIRVHSVLTWGFKGELRTLAPGGQGVDRFVPYHPATSLAWGSGCP